MPQMIKRKEGLVEHQSRIVDTKIVNAGLRNLFDRSNHVVAEVADSAAREWRKVRQLHEFEARHRRAQVFNEVRRMPITIARYEKWVDAQEGISRNPFPAFNALEKKCMRPILLQLQKRRHGRQEVRHNRFVDRNHVPLRLKIFDFFQTGLHMPFAMGSSHKKAQKTQNFL